MLESGADLLFCGVQNLLTYSAITAHSVKTTRGVYICAAWEYGLRSKKPLENRWRITGAQKYSNQKLNKNKTNIAGTIVKYKKYDGSSI